MAGLPRTRGLSSPDPDAEIKVRATFWELTNLARLCVNVCVCVVFSVTRSVSQCQNCISQHD